MSKGIKRYYIMPNVWRTVTESQVFNWIKIINENGIETDCISLTRNKQNAKRIHEIENNIKGKFYQFFFYGPLVNDIFLFFELFKLYLNDIRYYDKVIFQTRVTTIGIPLYILKLFPRTRIIFESRGATIEEKKYVNENNLNFKKKIKTYLSYFSEKLLIEKSNAVICVSNALKEYYFEKFKIENRNKFIVFPGAADSFLFFMNSTLRERIREKLNYKDDDIVIIYIGALNMKWEIPDVVFSFLKDLSLKDKLFKFLIVTPDVEFTNTYISKYKLKNYATVLESPFNEVNHYLNAADIGLLLREDILMNNVASPTKFSEYLLAGLPAIISKGILDFSSVINKTKFGVVLNDLNYGSNKGLYEDILKLKSIDHEIIQNWAKNNLSKEIFLKKYIKFLHNV